jgi:hypothetical protein
MGDVWRVAQYESKRFIRRNRIDQIAVEKPDARRNAMLGGVAGRNGGRLGADVHGRRSSSSR